MLEMYRIVNSSNEYEYDINRTTRNTRHDLDPC